MKKGFTLIELLAVIVILAIIAVIAVPIVLNIIDETKNNAGLRSAEMYIKAAELSIANSALKNINIADGSYELINGDICIGTLSNNECNGEILEVEVNGKLPESGTITITNGNISALNIFLNEKEMYKTSQNELVYVKYLDEICTPAKEQLYSSTPKTAGYKYECKVDPNKEPYTFYVLTTPSSTETSINLIMNANINLKGEAVIPKEIDDTGVVAWINTKKYYEEVGGVVPEEVINNNGDCQYGGYCVFNDKGPLTALNYLKEATKTWTNTNEMILNAYTDEKGKSTKNMETYNIYARMLIYLDDIEKTEVVEKTEANGYLYDNLDFEGTRTLDGYWTFSSYSGHAILSWYVSKYGAVQQYNVDASNNIGVRPVITLKI